MPLQSDAIRAGQLARRTSNQFLEATSEQLRHDCQFHTPQSIATPLPVSGASPWTFCRRMKLAIAILVAATLTGCGSKPVDDMPDEMEIVGVWECSDIPSGFLTTDGVAAESQTSQISIREDGTCSVSNFPQRSPYRFIAVTGSSWTFADPSMTPGGGWSVEFDGNFLQCRRNGDALELRYLISGKDGYSVTYQRAGQGKAAHPNPLPAPSRNLNDVSKL